MITVRIQNLDQVRAAFMGIRDDQIPFATARALSITAQQAANFISGTVVPSRFTVREPARMKQGVWGSERVDKRNLVATVADQKTFMGMQESGGMKVAVHGHTFLAVPLSGARPSVSSRIDPANRPAAVMARGGFIRDGIIYATAYKTSRRKLSGGRFGPRAPKMLVGDKGDIFPMYALVREADLPARYGFVKSVADVIARNFGENFLKAWLQAMKTAR